MAGKAKERKTFGNKLKDQQEQNKTLYSLASQGTITQSQGGSIVSGSGSGSSGGVFQVSETDLDMNTYDITNVDRLKFAAKSGASDALTANDYGIEAIFTSNTAYGLQIRIPEQSSDTFKIYRGTQEEVSISQAGIVFTDYVTIASGNARKPKLVLAQYDSSATPANPTSGTRTLFVDGTNSDNLSVKKSDGTVIDLEGTSGANVNLSNLQANTAVNVHLLPSTSENKNLGSTTKEWSTLYLSSGLYFGAGQNSSTLNHTDGLLFNITDDNDWYEFQIDGDRKMSIGDTKTIIDGNLEPDGDNTRDLGSSTKAWKDFYVQGGIYLTDSADAKITHSGSGTDYTVGSGDYHWFEVADGTNIMDINSTGVRVYSTGSVARSIRSYDANPIGFHVTSSTSVGSEGTMELPYISNTENTPSDSDLNGWFGSQNGCIGIQYYSTTGQNRIWIKANSTWVKAFAT